MEIRAEALRTALRLVELGQLAAVRLLDKAAEIEKYLRNGAEASA